MMMFGNLYYTDNLKELSLLEKEQKSEWYLKINPNGALHKMSRVSWESSPYFCTGRLPAIIDHSRDDFVVWESSAILLCNWLFWLFTPLSSYSQFFQILRNTLIRTVKFLTIPSRNLNFTVNNSNGFFSLMEDSPRCVYNRTSLYIFMRTHTL